MFFSTGISGDLNDDIPVAVIAGTTTIVKVTAHGGEDTDSDLDPECGAGEHDTTLSQPEENNEAPYDSQTEADRHQLAAPSEASSMCSAESKGASDTHSRGNTRPGAVAAGVPAIAVMQIAEAEAEAEKEKTVSWGNQKSGRTKVAFIVLRFRVALLY